MSTDQRLDQYFGARATTVELRPGDPTQIATRATARRRRRRSIGTGITALALVAAALGVQQAGGGDDHGQLAAEPGLASAAPLEWTSVRPTVGIAGASSTAVTADGTMYGLSTAPGRHQPGRPAEPQVLYRSGDGVEWQTVAVPDDLYPSRLAANGDQLYAVGTAPAGGGGRALVLARAGADGAWARADLPLDLAELESRYPNVGVGELGIAVNGSGAVATVTLMAWPGVPDFVAADADVSGGWTWTTDGLEVFPQGNCAADRAAAGIDASRAMECEAQEASGREPTARYSWDELGIDERLRSLILGEIHVFTSVDGTTFTEADLPDIRATNANVAATGSGYMLVTTHWSEGRSDVFRSVDGQTWTADPAGAFDGVAVAAGSIGERAAVVTADNQSSLMLRVAQDDGTWTSTDLTAAVDVPAGHVAWGGEAQFGPMGLAAAVSVADPDGPGVPTYHVVFVDDRGVSTASITDIAGPNLFPVSVRVSADAVTVALGDLTDTHSGDEPPTMQLLVGTPAG